MIAWPVAAGKASRYCLYGSVGFGSVQSDSISPPEQCCAGCIAQKAVSCVAAQKWRYREAKKKCSSTAAAACVSPRGRWLVLDVADNRPEANRTQVRRREQSARGSTAGMRARRGPTARRLCCLPSSLPRSDQSHGCDACWQPLLGRVRHPGPPLAQPRRRCGVGRRRCAFLLVTRPSPLALPADAQCARPADAKAKADQLANKASSAASVRRPLSHPRLALACLGRTRACLVVRRDTNLARPVLAHDRLLATRLTVPSLLPAPVRLFHPQPPSPLGSTPECRASSRGTTPRRRLLSLMPT